MLGLAWHRQPRVRPVRVCPGHADLSIEGGEKFMNEHMLLSQILLQLVHELISLQAAVSAFTGTSVQLGLLMR